MTAAATNVTVSMNECEMVDVLVHFFTTRLLQKKFRPAVRKAEDAPQVAACEAAFRAVARDAACAVAAGRALDAPEWAEVCAAFSEEWIDVCHWLSPKKFREHLTGSISAVWAREEEIPAELELPPIDLKYYKADLKANLACACACCDVVCNSLEQYKAHVSGRAHKVNAQMWSKMNPGAPVEPVMLQKKPSSPRMAFELRKKAQAQGLRSAPSTLLSVASSPSARESSAMLSTPSAAASPLAPALDAVPRVSFSSWAASSEVDDADSSQGSLPTCSRRASMLDAVYPVPARVCSATTAPRDRLAHFDFALARLAVQGSTADAQALGASLVAAGATEDVMHAVLDAAVGAEDAGPVAAVAAALMHEDAEFGALLAGAVVQRAAQRALATSAALFDNAEFFEAKARARLGGLVRFVSAMVCHGALPVTALQKCFAAALEDPTATDMANACKAATAAGAWFDGTAAAELKTLFANALQTKYFPRYVQAMVAAVVAA